MIINRFSGDILRLKHIVREHIHQNQYLNQDFGVSLQVADGWSGATEKTTFFDRVTFRTDKNISNLFLIKNKIPTWGNPNKLRYDIFVRLHVLAIKRILKKLLKGREPQIEQGESQFLGRPAYLIQTSLLDGQASYTIKNYLLKHKGRIFGIGYKLKQGNTYQLNLSQVEEMIASIQLL